MALSNDPRVNLGTKCERARKREAQLVEQKRDIFDTLGKIGQLDVLNDIGGSKVGRGLRVLHSISDLVRTGQDPKEAKMDPDTGAYYALETCGMVRGDVRRAETFNPMIANRGYQQAKDIYNKVKEGNFEIEDIPNVISDLQNLSGLIGRIFTGGDRDPREYKLCESSPYAMDLIRYAPKFKFMFIVEFKFSPAYAASMSNIGNYLAFVVKSATRPKIDFEYEEVNMYNFRTQVVKRAKFEPMTMKFLDDNQNRAGNFHCAYLNAMSPQTNMTAEEIRKRPLEESSMNFSNANAASYFADPMGGPPVKSHVYSSSTGSLTDNSTMNILEEVRLYHIYSYGRLANIYTFVNPKITSLDLDELDMSIGDSGSELAMNFVYDSINILTDVNLAREDQPQRITNLSGRNVGAIRPIVSVHSSEDAAAKSGEDKSFLGRLAKDAQGVIDSALGAVGDAFDYVADKADGWLSGTYDVADKAASDAYESGKRTVGDTMKKLGIF